MIEAQKSLDDLQRLVLQRCDEWFGQYPSAAAVYVFGSVARGDYRPDSDVDIFVRVATPNSTAVEDFTKMHYDINSFTINLMRELNRTVSLHGMVVAQSDEAWPAIERASRAPVASIGKAHLVPTPKKQ